MAYISLTIRTGEQYSDNSVCMNDDECRLILPFFKRIEKEILKKYERYKDIRDGGEATERQTDLLCDYGRNLESIQSVISACEELIKPSRMTDEEKLAWELKNMKNKSRK